MVAVVGGLGYYEPNLNGFVEDNNPTTDIELAGWMDVVEAKSNGYQRDTIDGLMHNYIESDDYGSDWVNISSNLPQSPAMGRNVDRINTVEGDELRSYIYNSEKAIWEFNTYGPGGIGIIDYIPFNTNPTVSTPLEGYFYYNSTDKTWNAVTDDAVIQLAQEQHVRIKNNTGSQIDNGELVFINGVDSGEPTMTLAQANTIESSQSVIGMATVNIANGTIGKVTTFGYVRDIDTSSCNVGDNVYLSASVAGGFTNVQPQFPNFVVKIGVCRVSDASIGEILFSLDLRDIISFFNGTVAETFNALATSTDGININMTLERAGGGDLTQRFSSGYSTYDTSPAISEALVEGTDSVPKMNYSFIPESTGVLTVNQTGFPDSTEHVKISAFFVQSASKVQGDGPLMTQNWNDHDANIDSLMGHVTHLGERLRRFPAQYHTGLDYTFTFGAGTSTIALTSGEVYQLHKQAVSAADMATGDDAHVINWFGDAYHEITDLFEIVDDSLGNSIGNNKYHNLVFWRPANKSGTYSPIMVNVSSASYTNEEAAILDSAKVADFSMPDAFTIESSTGFLICRLTFRMGATWTLVAVDDLRKPDRTAGSSGIGLQNEFSDALWKLFNNADNTKQLSMDLSGLTIATERTWTVQDSDGTVPLLEFANTWTASQTLGTGAVITSADEDNAFIFGRTHTGFITGLSDYGALAHRDHASATNFAVIQSPSGRTYINGVVNVFAQISNSTIFSWDANGIDIIKNGTPLTLGDGTNVANHVSFSSARATVGYDGADLKLFATTGKGIFLYANAASMMEFDSAGAWIASYAEHRFTNGILVSSGNVNLTGAESPIYYATDLSTGNQVWMGAQNSTTWNGNNSNIDHVLNRNNVEIARLTSSAFSVTKDTLTITGGGADVNIVNSGGILSFNSRINPASDSAYDLGTATTGRWNVVYRISESSASNKKMKTQFNLEINALDLLNKLKPQAFDWKHNIGKGYAQDYGLVLEDIPEELKLILHETTNENGKILITGIQYDNLTALNTKGIQETNDKVYNLEQEILNLKQQVKELLK